MNQMSLDSKTVLHGTILVVLSFFYFWPGALLFNSTGLVLGLPSSVFWFVFVIPILNIANALVWYRHMFAQDAQEMAKRS